MIQPSGSKVGRWKLRWGTGSVICPKCCERLLSESFPDEAECPVCREKFTIQKKVVTQSRSIRK